VRRRARSSGQPGRGATKVVLIGASIGGAVATAESLARRATKSPSAEAVTFAVGGHGWKLLRPGTDPQAALDTFLASLR
jgi:hypothetical protein